jgi:pyruvate-formate lyase-activating enzyme
MRPCVARADGSLEVLDGVQPLARSGTRLLSPSLDDLSSIPAETTLMHLPGRAAQVMDAAGRVVAPAGFLTVAAVLPVGYLRTLLPAGEPAPERRRLPLFGYTAVVEHRGELMTAASRTDAFSWWESESRKTGDVAAAVEQALAAMPRNRLVGHLAVCALEHRCYTAQNTFLRRYEAALPASPACNADCLGCISLQSDGEAPSPQPRIRFAPTTAELVEVASYHLQSDETAIVSFGQGCEGEPLTRAPALIAATREIRRRHPRATIHVNTNGSKPAVLERLIEAGCNSVRISAISFTEKVFRAYYRPVGYTLDDVVECGRVMSRAGGQVCLNLLTFPGVTDAPAEIERTIAACTTMAVRQIQWRSLNVDHDWLIDVLGARGVLMDDGIGLANMLAAMRERLPEVVHGNFTRPVVQPLGAAV